MGSFAKLNRPFMHDNGHDMHDSDHDYLDYVEYHLIGRKEMYEKK